MKQTEIDYFTPSICVEFYLKDKKQFERYYWDNDEKKYSDIRNWLNKSLAHIVKYVE